MKADNPEKDLHKGHRERLRQRFVSGGGELMQSHELLELLLYHVYSQRNTNDIARRLIKKFGTLYNIFEADEDELLAVEGVGPRAAAFLKLQAALLKRYNFEKSHCRKNMEITPRNAGPYILSFFSGHSKETLMMFPLDAECRLIQPVVLAKGTVDRVQLYVRDVVDKAISFKATYVIIAHNHPNGVLKPSANDLFFTAELEKALTFVNIRLVDHIIVTDNEYLSLSMEYDILNVKEELMQGGE